MNCRTCGKPLVPWQQAEEDGEGYEAHILAGGAPFGGEYNATIREAVATYQLVIAKLKREVDALGRERRSDA